MSNNQVFVLVPSSYAVGDAFVTDQYIEGYYGIGVYKKLKYVVEGISFLEGFDGELDQVTIEYLASTSKKIPQYVQMKVHVVHVDDTTNHSIDTIYEMIVSGDVPVRQTVKNSKFKYMHTLSLVEPTVYLEKWVMPEHANTRKYDKYGNNATLLNQVEDELAIAIGPKPDRSGVVINRFSIAPRLSTLLASRPAEEFFFDSPPLLREVLDEMFRSINARVRVNTITQSYNNVVIDYQSYDTELSDTVLPININSNISNSAFDKLSKNLEVRGQNALSSNRLLVKTDWDTFKSIDGSATLTTDNMGICTQHPIEKIEKMEINAVIKFQTENVVNLKFANIFKASTGGVYDLFQNIANYLTGGNKTSLNTYEYRLNLDITDYIYEKEDYDRLDYDDQMKALYYSKGDTTSAVGKHETFLFMPISALSYIIKDALYNRQDSLDTNGSKVLDWITDFCEKILTWKEGLDNSVSTLFGLLEDTTDSIYNANDMMYRLEYVPYIDLHGKFTKDNAIAAIPETTQLDNQSEKMLDITRFGDIEKDKINVLGNSEINLSCIAGNLSQLESLGKIINGGSLCITGREYSIYRNHVEVAYRIDADYQALRNKVKLDRERRVYDIPLANDQIDRKTIIKRFIQIGDTEITTNPAVIDLNHLALLLNPWKYSYDDPVYNDNTAIRYGIFKPTWDRFDNNHDDSPLGGFQMNIARYSMATSSCFSLKLYDNYSAGIGTGDRAIGGRKVLLNRYVNKHTGRYDGFSLQLAYGRTDIYTNYSDYLANVRKLPLITANKFSYNCINDEVVYRYPKDAFDRDIFTLQYEFVANSDNIIVGSKMAQINGLMVEGAPNEEIYIWASTTAYTKHEKRCLGSNLGKFCVSQDVATYNSNGKFYLRINRSIYGNGLKAIAFGTANGELALAYNLPEEEQRYYYIYFGGSFERLYNANFEAEGGYNIHYIVSANYPGSDVPVDVYNATKLPSPLPTLNSALWTFFGWKYATLNADGTYTVSNVFARANDLISDDVYLYASLRRDEIIDI